MAVVICALVPEEWGRLQRTEKGREHSKKGDSVSKSMRRLRHAAAQSGWERIAKGAIVHTASLPYSLQKQGGALTGNGGSPLRCQEDNLHESALGSGHGEES